MRVLHVASEFAPFAQTGGLGDVAAGLPAALAELDDVTAAVVVPLYRGVAAKLAAAGVALGPAFEVAVVVGPHAIATRVVAATIGRLRVGFVDCAPLYDRAGGLYGPDATSEFMDNPVRFAVLAKAALAAGPRLLGGAIDVLHVHDWQAALAAIYAREQPGSARAIVATIHNLAFRGIYPKHVVDVLGLPWAKFDLHNLEFWDQLCLLKGGLAAADAVTTVSPTYAHEILTPERGEALDAFMRADVPRLVGIVNGIDTTAWDPDRDRALPAPFSATDLRGKQRCRDAIARELGVTLGGDDVLIGAVGRFAHQKGFDLLAEIVPALHELGAKLIVLGSGEPAIEDRFRYLASAFADSLAVRVGFDLALSRRIYAGSDVFAMPSRFEPCGLGQLYAMRYGAIPVVHAVGGLRDTVIDPGDAELRKGRGTGVWFEHATAEALREALARAVAIVRDPDAARTVRRAAMLRDSSWQPSAAAYLRLYQSL